MIWGEGYVAWFQICECVYMSDPSQVSILGWGYQHCDMIKGKENEISILGKKDGGLVAIDL